MLPGRVTLPSDTSMSEEGHRHTWGHSRESTALIGEACRIKVFLGLAAHHGVRAVDYCDPIIRVVLVVLCNAK